MPELLTADGGLLTIQSVDNADDPFPSAEDMISTYDEQIGRSLEAVEGPSVVTWVWLPPFAAWPGGMNAAGFREWLGFRVTAFDAELVNGSGFYWPGIFVANDDFGPVLMARVGDGYAPDVPIARVEVSGWWTLGIAFSWDGRTEYYAAPGRVPLAGVHLLHTTPTFAQPEANRTMDRLVGNFWALRMTYPPTGQLSPAWTTDFFRVYVRAAPVLPSLHAKMNNGVAQLQIVGCQRGFRYLLQRSTDLKDWQVIADVISDGENWRHEEPGEQQVFYRVARP